MIQSVMAQSYEHWELVVVDDASTDDSLSILARWSQEQRIKVFSHDVNRGAGATFASAANMATGEILGMLGADDALRHDAVERMVAAHLADAGASLINSDLVACDEHLQPLGAPSPYRAVREGESLIQDCCVSNFATFKREAYLRTAGFDTNAKRAIDHDIFLKLEEVGSLGYVPEPVYLYRKHTAGISQGSSGMLAAQASLRARGAAYRRRLGTSLPNITRREYRTLMGTFHLREAQHPPTSSRTALGHLVNAVSYDPALLLRRSTWTTAARRAANLVRTPRRKVKN